MTHRKRHKSRNNQRQNMSSDNTPSDLTNVDSFGAQHVAHVSAFNKSNKCIESLSNKKFRQYDPVLDRFVRLHIAHVASSDVKVVDLPEDFTPAAVETAFKMARKEQLLGLLEYGIDIFAPLCVGSPEGKENWLLDFYGIGQPIARDLLMDDKDIVLKAYRKSKWKISLVGGSVAHWNRRRHFVAFLERCVIYNDRKSKNQELCDRAKNVLSIVIVQSAIMSYL